MSPFSLFAISTRGGFIRTIIGVVVIFVALKYFFHIDILEYVQVDKLKVYFEVAYEWWQGIWNTYLAPHVGWLIEYATIAWEFIYKYASIAWWKAAAIASKFLHTVPS